MPFTAGSVELTRAQKLGNQLGELFVRFGATGCTASVVEKYAKKLGFGITGLTTGSSFPPFGTVRGGTGAGLLGAGLEAALQNPNGVTFTGFTFGALTGQTVGIYARKYVRSGAKNSDAQTAVTQGNTQGAGATFEAYSNVANPLFRGFTATVYFAGTTTAGITYSIG
jgi:hypothetical protein